MRDEPLTPHPHLSDEINANLAASEIAGGAKIVDLPIGRTLLVKTKNTTYRIRRESQEVYTIHGHAKYCPTPTPCSIHGSTWGGSMLKMGYVGRGMHLEFGIRGHGTITTTEIEEIEECA
jgi:hypothetical protein